MIFVISFLRFMDMTVFESPLCIDCNNCLHRTTVSFSCPRRLSRFGHSAQTNPGSCHRHSGTCNASGTWNNGHCRQGNIFVVNSIGTRDLCYTVIIKWGLFQPRQCGAALGGAV